MKKLSKPEWGVHQANKKLDGKVFRQITHRLHLKGNMSFISKPKKTNLNERKSGTSLFSGDVH